MSIHLLFSNVFFWSLLSIITLFGIIWYYRQTLPEVRSFWRWLLTVLRVLALLILVGLIFHPMLYIKWQRIHKPDFGLLIDGTESMGIVDSNKSRIEHAQTILRSDSWRQFSERVQVHGYIYDQNRFEKIPQQVDSIQLRGKRTNIFDAIKNFTEEIEETNLSGLLLISDGQNNFGENPGKIRKLLGYPVHTLCVGDSTQKPDIHLLPMVTNSIGYANEKIPVEMAVTGHGYHEEVVNIELKSGSQISDQIQVTLPADGFTVRETLYTISKTPGPLTLSGSVSRFAGERTFQNNIQERSIRILRSKFQVLLIAEAPSPDLAFIKRILLNDPRIELSILTLKNQNTFYEGSYNPSIFSSKDALILLGTLDRNTNLNFFQGLDQYLIQDKKPLMLIAGKHVSGDCLERYQDRMPVQFTPIQKPKHVHAQITPMGRTHALFIQNSKTIWQKNPPLFSSFSQVQLKPGSIEVLKGVIEKGKNTKSGSMPLLVSRQLGKERTLVLSGSGLFRWEFFPGNETHLFLNTFFENVIRWLVAGDMQKSVQIRDHDEQFIAGDPLNIYVEIYDESARPLNNANVELSISSSYSMKTIQMQEKENGIYHLQFPAVQSDDYTLIATATHQGQFLGGDTTTIHLSSYNPEFQNTTANPKLLRELAQASGGQFATQDSLQSILEDIDLKPEVRVDTDEIVLYRSLILLGIVLVLLFSEWFIRKRLGML